MGYYGQFNMEYYSCRHCMLQHYVFRRFTDCGVRLAEPAHKVELTGLSRPQVDYSQPALTASHDDEETWFVKPHSPRAIHGGKLFDGYRCSAIFDDKTM